MLCSDGISRDAFWDLSRSLWGSKEGSEVCEARAANQAVGWTLLGGPKE